MEKDASRFASGSTDSPANSPDGTTHIGSRDGARVGGDEEGRSSPGQQHGDIGDTRAAAGPAAENLLGTGGEARRLSELPWDIPLKLADVKARFEAMTAARLTRGKTRE
jgi:hypothetical protein